MWDALWRNGKLATMTADRRPFGLIERGAVGVDEGRIAWVGRRVRASRPRRAARAVHDLAGRLLTPGLVDPHNHAVYYGDALGDFELLTQGGTRADMIASGGGVMGLVRQTRAASDEQIYAASAARVAKLIAAGITTLESKSGAGLDLETELRCLRIARELGRKLPVQIVTTFLGRARPRAGVPRPPRRLHRPPLPRRSCPPPSPRGWSTRWTGSATRRVSRMPRLTRLFEVARAHGLPVKLPRRAVPRLQGRPTSSPGSRGSPRITSSSPASRPSAAMAEAGTVATLAARRALDDGRDAAPARRALQDARGRRWRSPPTATRSARTPARRR